MLRLAKVLLASIAVMAAPLLGAALSGHPVKGYLAFPPRTTAVEPTAFLWPAFLAVATVVAGVLAPFLIRIIRHHGESARLVPARRWPRWGWGALALLVLAWATAWDAFGGPEALRRHAFTPLWLGYIGVVNAWTYRRTGSSLLTDRPLLLVGLLALSAPFWWLFEYLNQFAHNWHYVGLAGRGDWGYFLAATAPFTTVLPAVLSTRDLLATFPAASAGLARAWRLPSLPSGLGPLLSLGVGMGLLIGLGAWPDWFFPALWLGPLLVIWGIQGATGEPSLLDPLRGRDWRPVWRAALAALICGVFWEMWNWGSLTRWEYAVPYVARFHLFEMPLLGYAGYLPFGLECVAAASLVLGGRRDLILGLPESEGTRH